MKKVDVQHQQGFSLVEMAIVLIIFGFLIAALLLPLQAQRDIAKQLETEAILENSKKALLGFAQATGRLPCPATDTSNGIESPIGGGACTIKDGFLPSSTLGISGSNIEGVATDGWNHEIHYAVTETITNDQDTHDFTTTNKMSDLGLSNLQPNIRVICSTLDSKDNKKCNKDTILISNAVAVMYSLGVAGIKSGGDDEDENLNNDQTFVSHEPTDNNLNGQFDHIVTWLSPYILYNAMIQSGQLH